MIEIPLFFVLLFGVVLASVLIAKLPVSRYTGKQVPLVALQDKIGLGALNSGLFFLLLMFWTVLFVLLFGGLIGTIYATLTDPIPSRGDEKAIWNWRFSVLKMASLTAVLAAVVALPFTIIRLALSRQQVETAKDALLNDKITSAVADLNSHRQETIKDKDSYHEVWRDDIGRRNGAIDRLEGLVDEYAELGPRISRMLSAYVRELSREEVLAEIEPDDLEGEDLNEWAQNLEVQRSDMEKAVQLIGKLQKLTAPGSELPRASLAGANLQAMDLRDLSFFNADFEGANLVGTNLVRADMRRSDLWLVKTIGTNLIGAKLQGAELCGSNLESGVNLSEANLRGTSFRTTSLKHVPQLGSQLEYLFGDATVELPESLERPERFKLEFDDLDSFTKAWREFQRSIGQDPDNPQ